MRSYCASSNCSQAEFIAKKPLFTKQLKSHVKAKPCAKAQVGKANSGKADQEPPKIEFPCPDYPIKVVGRGIPGYDLLVIETVCRFCPDLDVSKVIAKDSAKGTFRSTTLYITAQSPEHLSELHKALIDLECVQMVI